MGDRREYPEIPLVGVGVVILKDGQVLLVKRGAPPSQGKWSLPGGLVQLGESTEAAALREVEEECGLRVCLLGLAGVVDRITHDAEGRIRYHYVLIDYLAVPEGGAPRAGSDAAEVRWVPVADLERYETTDGLAAMIQRAVRLSQGGTVR
ncbi:MAG: NUDIX hydrolase [Candidatus Rokubacteria bacterium]|nr:NUDIX hydrolase [Candidatus Rokubacteria bacterium]